MDGRRVQFLSDSGRVRRVRIESDRYGGCVFEMGPGPPGWRIGNHYRQVAEAKWKPRKGHHRDQGRDGDGAESQRTGKILHPAGGGGFAATPADRLHRPLSGDTDDPGTPLEETLEAFAQLIKQGKVRAIG